MRGKSSKGGGGCSNFTTSSTCFSNPQKSEQDGHSFFSPTRAQGRGASFPATPHSQHSGTFLCPKEPPQA